LAIVLSLNYNESGYVQMAFSDGNLGDVHITSKKKASDPKVLRAGRDCSFGTFLRILLQ